MQIKGFLKGIFISEKDQMEDGMMLNIEGLDNSRIFTLNLFKLNYRNWKLSERAPQNPYGQILFHCQIFGELQQVITSGIRVRKPIVLKILLVENDSQVDKMLIDLGIPVNMINWFEMMIEIINKIQLIADESRETLNGLKLKRDSARRVEDFEVLKELKIKRLIFEIGKGIWKLKKELSFCVAKEDYLRAIMELRISLKR